MNMCCLLELLKQPVHCDAVTVLGLALSVFDGCLLRRSDSDGFDNDDRLHVIGR